MKKIAMPHFDFESKKEYLQPAMEILEADLDQQLLAYSVHTDGLDDDDLTQDDTPGDSWEDAMGRESDDFDDEDW